MDGLEANDSLRTHACTRCVRQMYQLLLLARRRKARQVLAAVSSYAAAKEAFEVRAAHELLFFKLC